ncbi:MAG: hypothetical protein P4L46_03035 [Fimbriimonas sp.]|nr:hypothetical protein [Fimbriimonas sp.]
MKRSEMACLAILLAVPITAQDQTRMDLTKHGRVITGQVLERIKQACSDYTWSVQHNQPRPKGSLKLTDDVREKLANGQLWAILVPDHKIGGENLVSAVGASSAPADFTVLDDEYQLLQAYASVVTDHASATHASYKKHKAAGDNAAAKQDIVAFEQTVGSSQADPTTNGLVGSILSDVDKADLAGYSMDCVNQFRSDLLKSYTSAGIDLSAVKTPRQLNSFADVSPMGSELLSTDLSRWFGSSSEITKVAPGKDGSSVYGIWNGTSLMLVPYSGGTSAGEPSASQLEQYVKGKFGVTDLSSNTDLTRFQWPGLESYSSISPLFTGDGTSPSFYPHRFDWGGLSTITAHAPQLYVPPGNEYVSKWYGAQSYPGTLNNLWGNGYVNSPFYTAAGVPEPVVSFSRGWTEKSTYPQGESVAALAVSILYTGPTPSLESVSRLAFGVSSDTGGPPAQDWTPASLSPHSLDTGQTMDIVVGIYAGAANATALIGDSTALQTALKSGWSIIGKLPIGHDNGSLSDAINKYLASTDGFLGSICVSVERNEFTGYNCKLTPFSNANVVKPKAGSGSWYRFTTPSGASHWVQITVP